ncbi:MAG TPA: hypothetical protein VMX95_03310, partial [Thermodesulfobacteriota bacterium]|nr:hypothetical protein [Thermodesulfobacteriota bacterium]
MAIIASYFAGETYGLLGPQMAATIIEEHTSYECILIAVTREDDKGLIKKALYDYFGPQLPIVGFSTLSGREDLFTLAKELKDEGALTLLAGAQADVDYLGERDWQEYSNRFRGLSAHFSFAIHGPAEQAIDLLHNIDTNSWQDTPGLLFVKDDGAIAQNPKKGWEARFLGKVKWDNIFEAGEGKIVPLKVATGQVVQQIGCPHAARGRWVEIDYPVSLDGRQENRVRLFLRGCSFCDVAVDKGFQGALDIETVISQIGCLPEMADGRKIPFELINENPLPGLPHLLREVRARGIRPSQINLTLRADWFLRGEESLCDALHLARDMGVRILLASVGFESFDDRVLGNLNKGLSVETNLRAINLMRQLKEQYPREWAYSRGEGAIHGFIHPTPWDIEETSTNIQTVINNYGLANDILPDHSTPLIIHHASALGDWIREVEQREGVQFKRYGSIIGWW